MFLTLAPGLVVTAEDRNRNRKGPRFDSQDNLNFILLSLPAKKNSRITLMVARHIGQVYAMINTPNDMSNHK